MKITEIKLFCWLVAAAIGGWLGWIVYDFVQHHQVIAQPPSNQVLKDAVDTVPEPPRPKLDLVDYNRVLVTLKDLNWTGTPPPPPPEPGTSLEADPIEIPETPVADILSVLFITQDLSRPERSFVLIRYRSGPLASDPGDDTLRVGDSLPDPHTDISVLEILAQGVSFGFEDEARESETVGPPEFSVEFPIVQVGDGEVVVKPVIEQFDTSNDFHWPELTRAVGRDQYQIGTDDMVRLEDDFAGILSREMRYGKWKNPATGRYEGIEIKSLSENAYAKQYGLTDGDVIKSINGQTVTSSAGAISFVKKESKEKAIEKWYVVVSSKGKDKTIVVSTP